MSRTRQEAVRGLLRETWRPRSHPADVKVGGRRAADPRQNARGFFQTCSLEANEFDNDPSAGSPTETLLRLLLPLNAQVWESSRATLEVETSKGPVQIPH